MGRHRPHSRFLPLSFAFTFASFLDVSGSDVNVSWVTPQAGDEYNPGDSLIAKWRSDSPVVSPSFRLCIIPQQEETYKSNDSDASDDGEPSNCGTAVWPTVEQGSDGYSASLSMPDTSQTVQTYLRMEDDFQVAYESPTFSISTDANSTVNASGSSQASGSGSGSAPPAATSVPDGSSRSASAAIASSVMSSEPNSGTLGAAATNAAASSAAANSIAANMLASRDPAPAAAFAIPLSLVGVVVLIAAGLSLYHWRKLERERTKELHTLRAMRSSSSLSLKSVAPSQAPSYRERVPCMPLPDTSIPMPRFDSFVVQYAPGPRQVSRHPYLDAASRGTELRAGPSAGEPYFLSRSTAHSPHPGYTWSPYLSSRMRACPPANDSALDPAATRPASGDYFSERQRPLASFPLTVPPLSHSQSDASPLFFEDKPLPPDPQGPESGNLSDKLGAAEAEGRRLTP